MIFTGIPEFKTWDDRSAGLHIFRDGKHVADYDFQTGLTFEMSPDGIQGVAVADDILVGGEYKFIGNWVENGSRGTPFTLCELTGVVEGLDAPRPYRAERPWDATTLPISFVSATEKERRLNICRECPLFNHGNATCEVDNSIVTYKTRVANALCPNGLWEPSVDPENNNADQLSMDDQLSFERALEEYLDGA